MMNVFHRTVRGILRGIRRRPLLSLVPYVLIGGGTASYYAALTIRARDHDARVLLIGEEDQTPYRRSALSKELWWYGDERTPSTLSYVSPSNGRQRHICYEADGFYLSPDELDAWEHGGVALMRGVQVKKVDAENKFVLLEDGRTIEFDKCLIATGSVPLYKRIIDAADPALTDHITVLGDIESYRKLESKITQLDSLAPSTSGDQQKIVILGGGLLGTELAYSLNRRYIRDLPESKLKIIQLCFEENVLADILPPLLSSHLTSLIRSEGIDTYTDTRLRSITSCLDKESGLRKISLSYNSRSVDGKDGETNGQLTCDHLVIALGAEPRTDLAKCSGFELDNKQGGVLADASMQVKGSVWAAGDVCSFFDENLGRRRRCTHWQHAQITGRVAGENMTGGQKTYTHQGAFATMLGPLAHICGIGDVDARRLDSTVILAKNDENNKEIPDDEVRAIVLYTDPVAKNNIVGVLAYNLVEMDEEMARKLIRDRRPLAVSVGDYAKLLELWGDQNGDETLKDKETKSSSLLTDDEVDAYQRRED